MLVDFGYLASGAGDGFNGYYWADIDLCGYDWVPLQSDAAGSHKIWLMTYDDADPNTLYLATCAQPMLWGGGDDEKPMPDNVGRGEMSHQIRDQWDDDNPINAWHDAPQESYVYDLDRCPDPLGAMACFYVDAGDAECVGDLNGDGKTDQQDLAILLADYGCVSDCVGDLDGDDDTDQSDLGILLADWGCGT